MWLFNKSANHGRSSIIVPNTWHDRAKARFSRFRAFLIPIAALALIAAGLGTWIGLKYREDSQGQASGGAAGVTTLTAAIPVVETVYLVPTSAAIAPDHTTTSSAASSSPSKLSTVVPSTFVTATRLTSTGGSTASPTAKSSGHSPICDVDTFKKNASYVGVFNKGVVPEQFQALPAENATDCCQQCFGMVDRDCNGWGWLNQMCFYVWGYPGPHANETCPQGYPSPSFDYRGTEQDFAGFGPCAVR
ncbi:hypothetical protein JX265_001640 [Neoarthrinium moseri]|uniref:Uncharacterized protein n=1 Tax=Neoarthrinium moseri TaxID=1658444 RepID=A0A9Q0AQV9_9PEZI|nr:uncharacterized protein JN550_012411 [Neoarthrinium moseri]KAI1851244.1 hypothetical protein JX266_003319 [Neoarthrinium moseri]KAI1858849.1 hypothetical protein JN550_012411 [Neoarthrinium moseri]KAI1880019.1 hypothetical protein JX265_001640 [Neoarthrinium moseri]